MKNAPFYFFILLLILSLSASAQTSNVIYPRNYDTKFKDVYVDASNEGFAVGTCGVVARTTDAGMSWTLYDAAPSSFDYRSVTCPNDDCSGAVIAGDGIILKRAANGSFGMTVNEDYQGIRRLHDLDNNVVIADQESSTYFRSTDGGQTWAESTLPDAGAQGSVMEFANGTTGYVFDNQRALFKTTDGGTTWTSTGYVSESSPGAMHWRNADLGWYYQSGSEPTIFKTTDGGQTWADLNVTEIARRMMFMESFSDDHLFGVGIVDEIWESTDGGATWVRSFFPGQSGTRPSTSNNHHRRGDEIFVPSDAAEIFYSAVDFTNWEGQIPSDRGAITTVAFFNDDIGVAAGRTSFLIKTEDGGDSWAPLISGNLNRNAPVTKIDFRAEDTFVLYYGNDFPRITTDGGQTFVRYFDADSGLGQGDANVFHNFANGDVFVMGTEQSGISTDDGMTWTLTDHGLDRRINVVHFPTAETAYAAGERVLAKSTDGGKSWTELTSPSASAGWDGIHFFSADRGVISTLSRTAYLTEDGGASWTILPSTAAGASDYDPVSEALYTAAFESGNNGSLNRGFEEGDRWERTSFLCAAARGIDVTPSGNFVYLVGDGGHIERHATADITRTRNTVRAAISLKAFPNPTSGRLSVELPRTSQNTVLEVFGADGRRVQSLSVPIGTERFDFSLEGEKPGLYVLHWVGNDGTRHTGRLVLR